MIDHMLQPVDWHSARLFVLPVVLLALQVGTGWEPGRDSISGVSGPRACVVPFCIAGEHGCEPADSQSPSCCDWCGTQPTDSDKPPR